MKVESWPRVRRWTGQACSGPGDGQSGSGLGIAAGDHTGRSFGSLVMVGIAGALSP